MENYTFVSKYTDTIYKYQIKDSFSIILVNGSEVVEEFVVTNEKNNKVVFERGNINEKGNK